MGQWVVTVAGIVILSVLCDVILPDGQTRKYIKTVIGIVVTVVMLQPIIKLAGGAFNVETNTPSFTEVQVQQSYLDMVDSKQLNIRIANVKDMLKANEIDVQNFELSNKDRSVTLKINSSYSSEKERLINNTVKKYFVDYKINIIWLT